MPILLNIFKADKTRKIIFFRSGGVETVARYVHAGPSMAHKFIRHIVDFQLTLAVQAKPQSNDKTNVYGPKRALPNQFSVVLIYIILRNENCDNDRRRCEV